MTDEAVKIIKALRQNCDEAFCTCAECGYDNPEDCCDEYRLDCAAANLIEKLSKENEELKNFAKHRLKRKNMYKERSEQSLCETIELRNKIKELENRIADMSTAMMCNTRHSAN